MERALLERIEEAALNAWPAPRQMVYDGWLLRFAAGYTKRANSVNPRYASSLPFEEKLAYCEGVYAEAGLPLLFRMAEPFIPDGLAPALEKAGYTAFDPTLILGREIQQEKELCKGWEAKSLGQDKWLQLRADLTETPLVKWAVHAEILNAIVPRKTLVGLFVDGTPVACGMGVLEGTLLGYFSVLTAAGERRKGYGGAVMQALTQWGADWGAGFGYLQVEGDNEPARVMYARLGFDPCYAYHYCRKAEAKDTN